MYKLSVIEGIILFIHSLVTSCHNDESKDPNARGLVNTVFNERAKTRQSVVRRQRTEKSQNKNL